MSSKHVSGDQGLDWGQASGTAEMSKPLPEKQSESLKCPRCSSSNTKFCYYNNYNKSQPRHFCKSCKRHWTKGGTLRNVPVGGHKRPKISKATGVTATVPATASAQQYFLSGGQKNISNILYQHETSKGVDATALQIIPNTEFQLSSLSTSFNMNGSLNPALYHQPCDQLAGSLDSVEESAITDVNIGDAAWAGAESSSTLDLPNYWNWNDIDVLISGDASISWDYALIKR